MQVDDVLLKAEARTQTCISCWKAQRMVACVREYGTALVVADDQKQFGQSKSWAMVGWGTE